MEWQGLPRTSMARGTGLGALADASPLMPMLNVSTLLPPAQQGKGICHFAICDDGSQYHLKGDIGPRPSRAAEWIGYRVARRLGFTVPDFSVVRHGGDSFFGSRNVIGAASRYETDAFLSRAQVTAEGTPSPWPGQELARLIGLDLLLGNPDRISANLLLATYQLTQRLYLIDFGDINLATFGMAESTLHNTNTARQWLLWKRFHELPLEMTRQVIADGARIDIAEVERFLHEIPEEWLTASARSDLRKAWSSGAFRRRCDALIALVNDGKVI